MPGVNPSLLREKREIVIRKDEFDVFTGNNYTNQVLEALSPERVFVYGVATNVCVNFAVQGLLNKGKKVYVVEDAIKELPHLPLEATINSWKSLGAKFVKTAEVADYVHWIGKLNE
jgi:nicotinamidase/pyrazinamidase